MENKYYTPILEEFHVGFECKKQDQNLIANELDNKIGLKGLFGADYKADTNKVFKKHIINHNDIYYYGLNPHLIKNEIRVKHLDREDIESCGFEFDKTNGYNSKDFHIEIDDEDNMITITQFELPEIVYFKGTIKNKSEFKKVLKQIGI